MNLPELPENQRWRVHRALGYLTVELQEKSLVIKGEWSPVDERVFPGSTASEFDIETKALDILSRKEAETYTKSLLGIYPPGRE